MSEALNLPKHTPFYGFEFVGMPATRKEALATGAKHYFMGKPCKRGHVAPRFTSVGTCLKCKQAREKSSSYREYRREYESLPKMRTFKRAYERLPARRDYRREYEKLNARREYDREFNRRREASKRNATPPWLTASQIDAMRAIYSEATRLTEATGVQHHVDHIIPLVHPGVQGLHVPWNLQILTAEDNWQKNNAFDGTQENESWKQ